MSALVSKIGIGGHLTVPIVAVSWNSERFDGRNLALRLVALGYTNVYWYRGGREAWEVAGLPETEVDVQVTVLLSRAFSDQSGPYAPAKK